MRGSMQCILSALTLILLFLATTSEAGVAVNSPTGDPTLLPACSMGALNGAYANLLPYLPKVTIGVVFALHMEGLGSGANPQEAPPTTASGSRNSSRSYRRYTAPLAWFS
jgi:hypothetical protein